MSHPEGDRRHFLSLKGKCLLKPRAVPFSVAWSGRNATVALKGSWWWWVLCWVPVVYNGATAKIVSWVYILREK